MADIQGIGSLGAYFKALWGEYKTGNNILKIKPILADQGFSFLPQEGKSLGTRLLVSMDMTVIQFHWTMLFPA